MIKRSNIIFLSKDPSQHQELTHFLENREDPFQLSHSLNLDLATQGKVDLILIDTSFSYFKIFRFLKQLQRNESTACILLMGNHLDVNRISALLRAGIFDYLSIPFPFSRLEKAIRKGLKNRENLLNILDLSNRLAVSNKNLLEEKARLQKWNEDLSKLYQLHQKLTESLHIDQVVQSLMSCLKDIIPFDIACLYLKEGNKVHVEADRNKWGKLIDQLAEETEQDGIRFIKVSRADSGTIIRFVGSEILAPLKVGKNKIGLLRLIRMPDDIPHPKNGSNPENRLKKKFDFDPHQSKMLSMISVPLSLAIRNSETYQQVKDRSVKDALTNVLNRRAFSDILSRETNRAERYESPMSLMVIDLDHFKKVNDTYGHLVGDQILREMACIFKENIRSVDILFRYGGEEFVVILPGTSLQNTLIVARRIKKQVETALFHEDGEPIRMTVSMGLAEYPAPTIKSPKAVFHAADQALYRAKRAGRNRISTTESQQLTIRNPSNKEHPVYS
ncbi:MAG: diguanylate cyclase [Nitrospiria bacterium]